MLLAGLSELAGDGIGGGFCEGGARRRAGMLDLWQRAEKHGADSSGAEVGENLGGSATFTLLGGAELLLLRVAEAGGDPGEDEDRHQGGKGARAGDGVKKKTDDGSRDRAGGGDAADGASEDREDKRDQGGGEKATQGAISSWKWLRRTLKSGNWKATCY